MSNRRFYYHLFVIMLGISAALLILLITPFGAGVSPDSTVYIGAAKNIIAGKGYWVFGRPVVFYPPFYPLFLAGVSLFEHDLVQAARLISATMFGISSTLIFYAVYLSTRGDLASGIFAVLVFISSSPLIILHAWAWTEPLFIMLLLITIILIGMYVRKPSLLSLLASSIPMGLAMITRYVGVAFLPAVLAILFFHDSRRTFRQKSFDMFLWLSGACFPLGLFLLRNELKTGSLTGRGIVFHPASLIFVDQLFKQLLDFVMPIFRLREIILPILLVMAIYFCIRFIARAKPGDVYIGRAIPLACYLLSLSYIVFLFISISFFDKSTPIDARLISPIFVILMVGLVSTISIVANSMGVPLIKWSFIIVLSVSILTKAPETMKVISDVKQNGLGYSAPIWKDSESIAYARSIDNALTIYSNGVDVLDFLEGQVSKRIPRKMIAVSEMENQQYLTEMIFVCDEIKQEKAIIIYFNNIDWRWYMPSIGEILSICPVVAHHFDDGVVIRGE